MELHHLAELLKQQWALVRKAPIPYIVGMVATGVIVFATMTWGYERVLAIKDAMVAANEDEIKFLKDELQVAKERITPQENKSFTASTIRDPDALYQANQIVAHVSDGHRDTAAHRIVFNSGVFEQTYDYSKPANYQESLVKCTTGPLSLDQGKAVAYSPFNCDILQTPP